MLARQAPDAVGFDELMIVQYKSRFQFFHMALLDPHYWPLMCAPAPRALPPLLVPVLFARLSLCPLARFCCVLISLASRSALYVEAVCFVVSCESTPAELGADWNVTICETCDALRTIMHVEAGSCSTGLKCWVVARSFLRDEGLSDGVLHAACQSESSTKSSESSASCQTHGQQCKLGS